MCGNRQTEKQELLKKNAEKVRVIVSLFLTGYRVPEVFAMRKLVTKRH